MQEYVPKSAQDLTYCQSFKKRSHRSPVHFEFRQKSPGNLVYVSAMVIGQKFSAKASEMFFDQTDNCQ